MSPATRLLAATFPHLDLSSLLAVDVCDAITQTQRDGEIVALEEVRHDPAR